MASESTPLLSHRPPPAETITTEIPGSKLVIRETILFDIPATESSPEISERHTINILNKETGTTIDGKVFDIIEPGSESLQTTRRTDLFLTIFTILGAIGGVVGGIFAGIGTAAGLSTFGTILICTGCSIGLGLIGAIVGRMVLGILLVFPSHYKSYEDRIRKKREIRNAIKTYQSAIKRNPNLFTRELQKGLRVEMARIT
jgi:hypothetical protein